MAEMLMKQKKVRCPECRHTVFKRTMTEPVEILVSKDCITDSLVQAPFETIAEFHCAKCGRKLNQEEMRI